MAVKAISDYTAVPNDLVENFNGMQLLYVHWRNHIMFCAPFALLVSPEATFPEVYASHIQPAIAPHPEAAKIKYDEIQWELNGQPFSPSETDTLLAQGIDHKSMLSMITPGLNGLYNVSF
ncbi:phenol hydroxylase [Alteromonas sp. KS69]|jgi:phenol hydroxylase P4 protein|uniref:phenol hydroxylase subunit P4 n=1 Tax=Alteromonas sp. KS69 TaxID=2109917 RepID=UPI000F8969BC|nr:phenol hydroxylase subunit P4 [Alteromonas sp. KS69]RUP78439.1 phenol hydroxylase [Alteromonas sp. KS69]